MPFELLHTRAIEAIQAEYITHHGGRPGLRSDDLIESLDARAKALNESQATDLASLAVCYAEGLARNEPFVDGNLATALVCTELFLSLNGQRLIADDSTCVLGFSVLASGELSAEAFGNWVRAHISAKY